MLTCARSPSPLRCVVWQNIPPRQETLIEVDLSRPQKVHYKALYQKDLSLLMRGSKGDLPSLENLGMQLRKCSNHPWLLKGVEDTAVRAAGLSHARDSDHPAILELMVNSSGKFILLRKMLQKLRSEGHRVLVFSQMTRALDLIEDAVRLWQLKYERIDGGVTGNARQAAIDRFCKEGSDRFVFLLSTTRRRPRPQPAAGGLHHHIRQRLEPAERPAGHRTIAPSATHHAPYASHRAHRTSRALRTVHLSLLHVAVYVLLPCVCAGIGQTKEVQVYRLIAKQHVRERHVRPRFSSKLGLGHAIMGSMAARPWS